MIARTLFTTAMAALLVAGPAFADEPRERLSGSFAYAGGEPQKVALETAIDRATDGIFFAVRPIARGKLRDKTQVKPVIGFAFQRGNITSTATGLAPVTSREDGTFAVLAIDGDRVQLSQKLTPEGHLVQTFVSSEGTRTNDCALAADGQTLAVSVTVTSSRLTRPLRYALTYRRAEQRP